jgi:tripartite-type tricarboxylate transporter receptor subunit TctC
MKKALEAPTLREKLDKIGVQTMPMAPEEFGKLIETELKTYGDFVKKAGIKVN